MIQLWRESERGMRLYVCGWQFIGWKITVITWLFLVVIFFGPKLIYAIPDKIISERSNRRMFNAI